MERTQKNVSEIVAGFVYGHMSICTNIKMRKETHEMQTYCKKRVPQAQQTQMGTETAKRPKSRKRGLFHSPNIRITCIIRNFIKFKIRHFSFLRS